MCIFRDVLGMDQSTTTYWDSIQLWKPSIELCGTCWKWFSQIYFCREEQHSNQKNILKSLTGTITQRNEREREKERDNGVLLNPRCDTCVWTSWFLEIALLWRSEHCDGTCTEVLFSWTKYRFKTTLSKLY